jgi:RecA-family ATPase
MQGNFSRASFVWDRFIVRGYPNLLTGEGGAGKTTLAVQLATSVASGTDFLGLSVEQMPVLLVLAEDDYGETRHRYQLACDAAGLSPDKLDVHFWCRVGMDSTIAQINDEGAVLEAFAGPLSKVIKSLGPCLVVCDTVVDIALLDENARVPVNSLAKKLLGQLCRRSGATLLVTAHPSKASLESGAYYAGSTAWNGAFRSRMVLQMDKEDIAKRTLVLAKSNYSSSPDVELYMQDGLLVPRYAAAAVVSVERELAALRDLVFDLLEQGSQVIRSHGNGLKPRDLVEPLRQRGVRMTSKRIAECLSALEVKGVLRYQAADKNVRGSRAGFVRGPLANGPLT